MNDRDYSDLIIRLRGLSRYAHSDITIGDEAADAIEQLQAGADAARSGELWALCFIADIRAAVLDDGKRMRPELIEYLRGLVEALCAIRDGTHDPQAARFADRAIRATGDPTWTA